jgi:hypothetical protein
MSKTAFLEDFYEQQTVLANQLKALKDGFTNLVDALSIAQNEIKKLAEAADENCAELYNYIEEPMLELKPLDGIKSVVC